MPQEIAEAVKMVGQLNQDLAVAEARHSDAMEALEGLEKELQEKYKTTDHGKLATMQETAEKELERLLQEVNGALEAVPEA